MYIRKTTRKRKDGSSVAYLQLAHKVRDPKTGIPRDEILYHFGREDELNKDQIRSLINSLGRFLEPGSQEGPVSRCCAGMKAEKSISYGASYLLEQIWRKLKLHETFKKLLAGRSYQSDCERLIFSMVANRCLDPRSKLAMENWVGKRVHISGLEEINVQNLYRAMDFLVEHEEEIQREVFFSVANVLNLQVDLLFFDTTSTYFEIEGTAADDFRKFGHSKDHRSDLPQVVIGLAVTREGIPVRCWVLPGNTTDASVVDMVQSDLAGWKLNRVVWVVDRGFSGEPQRVMFQRGGGHVITGEKLRGASEMAGTALENQGRFRKIRDDLEIREINVTKGSLTRKFVLVRNESQARRDAATREALLKRLEEKVESANAQIAKKKTKVHGKLACELKSNPTYGRFVRELKSGLLKIDQGAVRADEKFDGKYLLSTTDLSLTSEEVALGYKQLWCVERSFRTMKTSLELRPVYHRVKDRIKSHVMLCWLGLLMVRVAEIESGETWCRIQDKFSEIHLMKLDDRDKKIFLLTELDAEHRKTLKSLGFSAPKPMEFA